jgi:hypothetical protein
LFESAIGPCPIPASIIGAESSSGALLGGDGAGVHLVPGLGDQLAVDAQDRRRGELDPPPVTGDAEELALLRARPALVRGDEVTLAEDQLDLVAEVGESGEEVFDRGPLALPPARLAVVDEVGGEQAITGARIALDDRLAVEAADQILRRLADQEPEALIAWAGLRYSLRWASRTVAKLVELVALWGSWVVTMPTVRSCEGR